MGIFFCKLMEVLISHCIELNDIQIVCLDYNQINCPPYDIVPGIQAEIYLLENSEAEIMVVFALLT